MLNPFETNAFSVVSLTKSINIVPNMYGRVNEMGLMPIKGVRNRTVIVEEQNGVLTLLNSLPVGAPSHQNKKAKRKARSFVVPHFPLESTILPSEYDGVRTFGTEDQTSGIVTAMNNELASMRAKHAITLEWLRCGALKGLILDADASTLYNLYTEFGISQKTVGFALTTATTSVTAKCNAVKRHIEANLNGEIMTGVRCLCGAGFFDALTEHANVKAAFEGYSKAAEMIGGDTRKGFEFGGIVFEEYVASAPDADGTSRSFIGDTDAHFYPTGTQNAFETLVAPADMNETVNTIGKELYAKTEPRKFGKGLDIYTESNVLPICYRPAVLVKGTKV